MIDVRERLRSWQARTRSPEPPPTPRPTPGRRRSRLPERGADRYLGGVASGLARAIDVDPFVVRLGLALGALYLPFLVVLYALAWLVLPDRHTHRSLLADADRPEGWAAPLGVAALGLGAAALAPDLGPDGDPQLTVGAVLLVVGFLLITGRVGAADRGAPAVGDPALDDPAGGPVGPAADPAARFGSATPVEPGAAAPGGPESGSDELGHPGGLAASTDPAALDDPTEPGSGEPGDQGVAGWEPPIGPRSPLPGPASPRPGLPVRQREPRPPAYLGWCGISALVVLAVVIAAVDQAWEPVKPGLAVSLGLVVAGAVLLVAAWRGRARLLLPTGVLLLPLWVGWAGSDVPRYEGDGDALHVVGPDEPLPAAFRHGYGRLELDLAAVDLPEGSRRTVRIGLTAGVVDLRVPRQVHLRLRGDVGMGVVAVEDGWSTSSSDAFLLRPVDRTFGDPYDWCQEVVAYDETGEPAGTELRDERTWEPCTRAVPPDDPAVLELVFDVGIGSVEISRA